MRKSKLTLLLLILIVLVCGTLVLGGTFATQVNLTGTEEPLAQGTDFNVTVMSNTGSGKTPLMYDGAILTDSVAWCPGRTEILYLEITNDEAFPVQVTFSMDMGLSALGDVFTYAVIPQDLKAAGAQHPANWAAFLSASSVSGAMSPGASIPLVSKAALAPGQTHCLALAVHMNETATSAFQNKAMDLTFSLRVDADYTPGATPASN